VGEPIATDLGLVAPVLNAQVEHARLAVGLPATVPATWDGSAPATEELPNPSVPDRSSPVRRATEAEAAQVASRQAPGQTRAAIGVRHPRTDSYRAGLAA
jgi:hypothetical protein